jgi:drug/metabolite transporter (DMT)-like permease
MPRYRDNARGITAMIGAMFSFQSNDSFVKAATAALPLGQTIFGRGLVASVILITTCVWTGSWRHAHLLWSRIIVYRIVGELGATILYLIALVHIPIGTCTAIFQLTPLAVTAGAALLGEEVGWRRWLAIAIGFLGVMIIIRPGLSDFNPAGFCIFAAIGFVVLRDLSTARMPAAIPTDLAAVATSLTVTAAGLAMMPFESVISLVDRWRTPNLVEIGLIIGAGIFLVGGYVLMTHTMRIADMAVVAPFRYTLLIWSFLFGMLFFDERPDAFTLIGSAIIVATGLYIVGHERARARQAAREAVPDPG